MDRAGINKLLHYLMGKTMDMRYNYESGNFQIGYTEDGTRGMKNRKYFGSSFDSVRENKRRLNRRTSLTLPCCRGRGRRTEQEQVVKDRYLRRDRNTMLTKLSRMLIADLLSGGISFLCIVIIIPK